MSVESYTGIDEGILIHVRIKCFCGEVMERATWDIEHDSAEVITCPKCERGLKGKYKLEIMVEEVE